MRPNRNPATYAELAALPGNLVGEIIDGELVASPRPAIPHTTAASLLFGELFGPFHKGRGGPGGWWLLHEPELHLGPDVLVPDLAGWRTVRLPVPPPMPWMTIHPDWVCEVLSPSTVALDRVRKKAIYAREKVEHMWLMDPVARTLEVYRLHDGTWVDLGAYSGDMLVRAEPFAEFELELGSLWLPEPGPGPGPSP